MDDSLDTAKQQAAADLEAYTAQVAQQAEQAREAANAAGIGS